MYRKHRPATATPLRPCCVRRHHTQTPAVITYKTRAARDAAAQRWAGHDGHPVVTACWDATHAEGGAGHGWTVDGLVAPSRVTVTLHIANIYELHGTIETTATVTIPIPPADAASDAYHDWAYEHIFAETGTGHTGGESAHVVRITASTIPDLVGRTFRFGL
ncbi:hypothetical protein [Dactylosporangium matsuzakiense]|uniref:Uncharacterized protein n=1 Tax=Dactylosporangium matsuzakiense TaxID=53360 RepID=A0A9W6NP57_9ACTN|nr:hypothetical protein [Dactylosporangium matsuzakiense]GLL03732.1 hypothetical protein GCM10017581_054780 [Dactylosporangium matsuzakiense]